MKKIFSYLVYATLVCVALTSIVYFLFIEKEEADQPQTQQKPRTKKPVVKIADAEEIPFEEVEEEPEVLEGKAV